MREKARPRAYASTIGMPLTNCATPAWVWPAKIASTVPGGSARATLEDLCVWRATAQIRRVAEVLAVSARVSNADHELRALAAQAAGFRSKARAPRARRPAPRTKRSVTMLGVSCVKQADEADADAADLHDHRALKLVPSRRVVAAAHHQVRRQDRETTPH